MNAINNIIVSINELRNGYTYYKDNGTITSANGGFISLATTGAGLTIGANGAIAGGLTVGSLIDNGNMSALGNVISFPSPNNIMTVANSIYTTNLYATNLQISGNAVIEGQSFINADAIILNAGGASAIDAWLEVYRGANNHPSYVLWRENAKAWLATSNVTGNVLSPILTTANLAALSANLQVWSEIATIVGSVNSPNTVICNLANSLIFDITLANTQYGDTTISFINPPAGANIATPVTLILRQASAFPNTATFTNNILWSGGQKPVLSKGTGVGQLDVLSFYTVNDGVNYVGGSSGGGGSYQATANAANTVEVIANYGTVYPQKSLNFANTNSVNVSVIANGANVDLFFNVGAVFASNVQVATAGQSNFTLAANSAGNNANLVIVTRNGLLQDPTMYTVSGNLLTLNTPALVNEVVATRVISNLGGAGGGGGGSAPGGSQGTVQFNNGGILSGSNNVTINATTFTLNANSSNLSYTGVSNNGAVVTLGVSNTNYISTPSVNVAVTANDGIQTNVAISVNTSNIIQLYTQTNVALGTQNNSGFVYYTVNNTAKLGLMSVLIVTANQPGLFDLKVLGSPNGNGTLFLSATDITTANYTYTMPFVYASDDKTENFYITINNRGGTSTSFNISQLTYIKFN